MHVAEELEMETDNCEPVQPKMEPEMETENCACCEPAQPKKEPEMEAEKENAELAKCARPGCPFRVHSTQGHAFCCNGCKTYGRHGPYCEQVNLENEKEAEKDATEEPGATIAEMIRLELENVLRLNGVCEGFARKVGARVEQGLRNGLPDDERALKFLNKFEVGRFPAVAAALAPEARRMDKELGDMLEKFGSDDISLDKSQQDLFMKILEKCRNLIEAVVWQQKAAGVQQLVGLVGTALKKYKETSAPWHELHPNVTCDGCGKHPIIGPRFKCNVRADFDLCGQCHKALDASDGHSFRQVGPPGAEHGNPMQVQIAGYLHGKTESVTHEARAKFGHCAVFDLAANAPRRPFSPPFRGACGAPVHSHITCDGCEQSPIIGERFKCRDMHDFDLCNMCYAKWQSEPSYLEQVPTDARFDEIDVTGRVKTHAAEREEEEEESDSEEVVKGEKECTAGAGRGAKAGKKRVRLLKKADKLRVKRLRIEQKRDFALAQAKQFENELSACDVEMKNLETKLAEISKEDEPKENAAEAIVPEDTKKEAMVPEEAKQEDPTPAPADAAMNAEPNLILIEDEDGNACVIPEELLADALSQCALNVAATEVATEAEKDEQMPEKESNASADSWEKVSEKQDDVEGVELIKCARPGCCFRKHSAMDHGFCCNKCKNDGGHGGRCERIVVSSPESTTLPTPEESDVETSEWEKAEDQFPCTADEVKASVLASQLSAGQGALEDFWEEPGHHKSEEFGSLMEQYRIQEVYNLGTPKLGDNVDRKQLQALILLANEGKEDWPTGTCLRCVAGHDLGVQSVELECNAGEVAEVVLHFDVNRGQSGPSYWAMVAPNGQPFGVLLTLTLPEDAH
jgi:hypothetical protein